jgi:hypothetical protein
MVSICTKPADSQKAQVPSWGGPAEASTVLALVVDDDPRRMGVEVAADRLGDVLGEEVG